MQWLTRSLDLCGSYSWASIPPSCRSKFLYWVYDDPSTHQSPDKIFVYGGIPGDASRDCAFVSRLFWFFFRWPCACKVQNSTYFSVELTIGDLCFGV